MEQFEFEMHEGNMVGQLLGTPFVKKGFITQTPKGVYFSGMFYFRDSKGLPLTFQFDKLQKLADERKIRVNPCIADFVHRAELAGWNRESAVAQISEMFMDIFGPAGKEMAEKSLTDGYWIQPR